MNIFKKSEIKKYGISLVTACLLASMTTYADTMLATGGYASSVGKLTVMKMVDANGDHMVTEAEFKDYYSGLFDAVDTNKDGMLDAKEWVGIGKKGAAMLGDGGYARTISKLEVMDAMDSNHDHKVTKDEFVAFHKMLFSAMDTSQDKQISAQEWAQKLLN